jgi:hypothetical protein
MRIETSGEVCDMVGMGGLGVGAVVG